ncbi:MAG: hypothetical protein QXL94_06855 [Candidatus Parvarchaeum sp.]
MDPENEITKQLTDLRLEITKLKTQVQMLYFLIPVTFAIIDVIIRVVK